MHELVELGLRPRRLCSESLHAMKRRQVKLFSAEFARDFIYNFISCAKNGNQRVIVVCKIESRKSSQGAELHAEVMAPVL